MRRDGSRVFHVAGTDAGKPLAGVLRSLLNDESADAAELLRDRRVQIDGNLCQELSRRLKLGEVIKVLPHTIAAPPTEKDIRVHFADEHLVVVEKPSGLTTMRHEEEADWRGRRRRLESTLDDLLPRVLGQWIGSRQSPSRDAKSKQRTNSRGPISASRIPVIPVHRLDRETSGLMVFALTPKAERSLVEQFREHSIDRTYLAVVIGKIEEQTIESYLARDRGDGKRGSVTDPDQGQRAVTHISPIESLMGCTLIECRLETGRTHQIRIHLSEAGHPVCGDKEYRGPLGQKPIVDRSAAPRLALHAAELGFEHPVTKKPLHFESKLPRELAQWLSRFRNKPHG